MKKRIFLIFMLSFLFILVSCTGQGSNESESDISADIESDINGESSVEPIAKSVVYAALGDSIPAGDLITDLNLIYPKLISDWLSESFEVDFTNYSVSGMKTYDLINLLSGDNAQKVASADYVTVCIGANNILSPTIDLFMNTFIDSDISYEDLYNDMNYMMTGTDPVILAETAERLSSFLGLLKEKFEDQNYINLMNYGIETLRQELPIIIEKIRNNNSDCVIYVNNIYNPYINSVLTFNGVPDSFDLGMIAEPWIVKLNQVYEELQEEYGYHLIDIYTSFTESTEMLINSDELFSFDPHPTVLGHRLIADIYIENWEK